MSEPSQHDRTAIILGWDAVKALSRARVALFGLGGVGGHCLEALLRSGIGAIDIFDYDTVDITNLNRQLLATHSTIGMKKTDAALNRAADIDPDCMIAAFDGYIDSESIKRFSFADYSYILDCVDNVEAKLAIAQKSSNEGARLVSCMGAGNKLDPSLLRVADIYQTSVCPLARIMRRELKKLGIKSLQAVYSLEAPMKSNAGRIGSAAFVPAAAGMLMASVAVRSIAGEGKGL
jgi:tRNA A37 threonylcarbamoyladenosine dehydratase